MRITNLIATIGIGFCGGALLALGIHTTLQPIQPADCPGCTYTACSPVALGSQIQWQGASWTVLGITITNGETRLLLTGCDGVGSVAVSAFGE